MSNWQPIETAPKDGTWILGCNNAGNLAIIIWSTNALRRRWYPAENAGRVINQEISSQFECGEGWIFPFTHGEVSPFWDGRRALYWMPLPKRPEPPK